MHEMGIALQIIDITKASIPSDMTAPRVKKIHLSVGKLSAIVSESLKFCFDVAVQKTPLEGAELVIREIPVTARCNDCGHEWTVDEPAFQCDRCNGTRIQLISGRELDIDSIEVEEDENNA
jgi:hydrogenase nickel incorporation protein HypA/HybF